MPSNPGQSTGMDGYTEDDVPMMQVGPPTIAHPDQVTSKPRQMPSGGGGGMGMPGMGAPGDNGMAPGQFDPAAMGADVDEQRAEGNDPSADADAPAEGEPDMDFTAAVLPRWAQVAGEIVEMNPGVHPQIAAKIATGVLARLIREGNVPWMDVADGAWTNKIKPNPDAKPLIDHKPLEDAVKQKVKDIGKSVVDRLRPKRPEGQGEPLEPEQVADDPQHREHAAPPRDPSTVGEWARQQMGEYGQEAVRDLWKLRYSDKPLDRGSMA